MNPIGAAIRWASIFACAFVVLSFLFFAVNQTSTASKNQVIGINGGEDVKPEYRTKVPNPSSDVEQVRERENDSFHEFVDDVDDVLASPFTGIVHPKSIWVLRLFVLGCALLIYGLLGLYLARAIGMRRF